MEDIRAFIAIELPDHVKAALGKLEQELKGHRLNARWVSVENIHLTLKFLGNISSDSVKDISQVIEEAAVVAMPFDLRVEGVGVFPNERRTQVIWAGVAGDMATLGELQKEIDSGLSRLGFAQESRPFSPHLTVARMREDATAAEREAAGKLVSAMLFEASGFRVESVSLMRSQLRREGPIYTRLVAVPLSK